MKRLAVRLTVLLLAAAPAPALAWGGQGHRMVGQAAMQALPPTLPAFLRTPEAVDAVGEYSREPDRSKGSGKIHDSNRDPGHFLDLEDDGRILAGPRLDALPATRSDYETALRAVGQDSWKAGYLPYSIVDQFQQLTTDMAYWRVEAAAWPRETDQIRKAWMKADQARREQQILLTIGYLSHFVGDGSQPLHVSAHYNGWGDYPNPNGYSTAKLHGPFEEAFVFNNVHPAAVRAAMTPFRSCGCPIEKRVADYLAETGGQVIPFYELEKAGGFAGADPRGVAFATSRVAAGASELRDLIAEAWTASAAAKIGWPAVAVPDVVSGKVDPYEALYSRKLMAGAPQFGAKQPGVAYTDRPAAFGIALRDGKIAVVKVTKPGHAPWFDLPGGALDPGEDAAQAVVREFGEETGLKVSAGQAFAQADQYFVNTDGAAYDNRGTFFTIGVVAEAPGLKIEVDHTLVWLAPHDAVARLRHDAHAWAVAAWLRRG